MKKRDYGCDIMWGNVPRRHYRMLVWSVSSAAVKHAPGRRFICVDDRNISEVHVFFHADKLRVTCDAFTTEVNALYEAKISAQLKRKKNARAK